MSKTTKIAMAVFIGATVIMTIIGMIIAPWLNQRQYKEEDIRKYTYWIVVQEQGKDIHYFTDNLTWDQYGNLILTSYVNTYDNDKQLYTGSEWQLISQGAYIIRKQK